MIHVGDLFAVLPTLAADSIDACVTDPPYELGFMGKHWDGSGVTNNPETWRQVFRVLKPGAHLLAFGGTRTYHRMTCAIEDAGFEIRDCLSWLYGSGFPKSLDVSKAIDAAAGAKRETIGPDRGRLIGGNGGGSTNHGRGGIAYGIDAESAPSTDLAKQWQGWGTALKPAWEGIVMARKPLRGTVAANVAQYGTGAINVDACRIEGRETDQINGACVTGNAYGAIERKAGKIYPAELGRWPANVLLDEAAAALLDEQTGELGGGAFMVGGPPRTSTAHIGQISGLARDTAVMNYGDTGGASRFFYVAKPSREERDYGCGKLPIGPPPASARGNPAPGRENALGRPRSNHHPTVKPVELMRYLVRLVTPSGGIVLDPFTGSGTTGMACRYESLQFVGIEREAEYAAIAEERIANVAPLFGDVDPTAPPVAFEPTLPGLLGDEPT